MWILATLFATTAIVLSARGTHLSVVLIFALAASLASIGVALFAAIEALRWRRVRSVRGELRTIAWIAASLLVVASVAITDWPLRAAYSISRPAFDAAARRITAGELMTSPRRIGLFSIRRGELGGSGDAPVACLWTDLDPSGFTGFVRCGDGDPPFNLWSRVALGGGWQFISED